MQEGSVVLPGETIATLAEDRYILRLQLPERHARFMRAGDVVQIGARGLEDTGERREGKVRLVYPEIEGGRVIADVEVPGLGDYFVGERTRVYVSTGDAQGDRRAARLCLSPRWRRLREARRRRRSGRAARGAPWRRRCRDPLRPQGRRQAGSAMKLGLSGLLTRAFINSPLTPLLLLAAIVAGALALASLPREEEPQISVPMVDIIVQANGYKADQAVELVTRPLEDIIKGIDGVEHVYSQTEDDRVVVTARFLVGTDQDSAITRVHEKIRAHIGELPKGIPEPLIVGRGINDVAIVDLTLSARPDHAGQWSDNALFQVAEELQHELTKVDNVGSTYIVGGSPNQIRVEPDPERLAVYGVTLSQLIDKLTNANRSFLVGAFRDGGKSLPVLAGQTLQGVPDIGLLLLTTRDGRPVYVKDVADVTVGAAEPEHRAWTIDPPRRRRIAAASGGDDRGRQAEGRQRRRGGGRRDAAARRRQRPRHPRGPRGQRHAQLWRDGFREGERACSSTWGLRRSRSSSSSPSPSAGARGSSCSSSSRRRSCSRSSPPG